MGAVWIFFLEETGCQLSLCTNERLEYQCPKIRRGLFCSGRMEFTVVSMPDILIQVVATENNSRLMYDYPEKLEFVEEYTTCKCF
jgi:hypothetical protein